jgi:hypothetical protein
MTATATVKPQLDYAPTLPWRRTRLARLLCGLLFLAALSGGTVLIYPRVRDQWQVLDWQARCMAAPVPPDAVVFKSYSWTVSDAGGIPFAWRKLYAAISPPGLGSKSTVFLHEMRTPGGKRRLVAVDIDWTPMRPGFGPYSLGLSARVIRPGAGMIRPQLVSTSNHSLSIADEKARVLAGALDPADPSHFTFTYEHPGRSTVFDGWLRDDDSVSIQERTK